MPLQGVLEYADNPTHLTPWLWMRGGMLNLFPAWWRWAQIVIFTTGRGTPAGNLIAPVIKVRVIKQRGK